MAHPDTTMHRYHIRYRAWHRTHRRMERHLATSQGRSRWTALLAWWRVQRQWQPLVELLDIQADHRGCPQTQYATHGEYTCALATPSRPTGEGGPLPEASHTGDSPLCPHDPPASAPVP